MKAGKRRTQVRIEQRSTTPTATGGISDVWTTVVKKTWAGFEVANPAEYFTASEHHVRVVHKVFINSRTGITPAMRLYLITSGRTMDILTVRTIDERGFQMELICEERTQ